MRYIDSHSHYYSEDFDGDRDILLPKLHADGVEKIISIGCSLESSRLSVQLAEKYDFFYAAVGDHPDAAVAGLDIDKEISETEKIYSESKVRSKIIAIGEIGLDYHYIEDDTLKPIQKELFERQLVLAEKLGLPVVIHSRDAAEDTLEILKKYKPKGVMHCYSYSAEYAKEILKLGMYVGFTGVLTFKNAKKAVKTAEIVPADRLLVETDCPYMAPEPFRGKRSDSSMIVKVIEKMAEIKQLSPDEMAEQTIKNTEALFGI